MPTLYNSLSIPRHTTLFRRLQERIASAFRSATPIPEALFRSSVSHLRVLLPTCHTPEDTCQHAAPHH
jgi:hypothetical protein